MTAVTPQLVLARLAQIESEIIDPASGSACVSYENVPYAVSVANMPLFLNFIGPLTQKIWEGGDENAREYNEVRNFNVVLYHSAYGSGIEGEKMGLLTPYFELVYAKFDSYPHLNALDGVMDARITSDAGVGTVQFSNQPYYGIRFTLQVTTRVRRVLSARD